MKPMGRVNVAGVLVLVSAVVLFYWHWEWFVTGEAGRESGSTTTRNLGLVAGGIIAIWVAIWRGVVADSQARSSQDQAKAALKQAETSQRGLLNERYQKGAEMLGSEVLSVRVGGIYALQRLASDEPERYHVQITHLFCTFVSHPTEDEDYMAALRVIQQKPHQLREDVQVAITAIGTRTKDEIELEKREKFSVTLTGANLAAAHVSGTNLTGANLTKADLTIANLINANLLEANLTNTNLSGADLTGANLVGANLLLANLNTTFLTNSFLTNAILTNANLNNANLVGADLTGATLVEANLAKAVLSGADLTGAYLMRARDLTQRQLDQARADPDNPPMLGGLRDAETDLPLEWHGKPCKN